MDVNTATMEATLVQELADPSDAIYAASQGAMQVLPNGHSLLGYGSVPALKEFDRAGNVALAAEWGAPKEVQSYRVYKAEWVGKPATKPSAVACKEGNGTVGVYMSWNGATEVESWTVYAGASNETLEAVKTVDRTGFETTASIGAAQVVRVEAAGEGIETGVSDVVEVKESC